MGAISQLLFPPCCLLCKSPGSDICNLCDVKINRVQRPLRLSDIPVWAGAMYGDELSELILLAKEKHNSAARNFLAELLVESFMRAGTDFGSSVSLVPIPSSKRSNRSRGYRHAYLLTRELMKRLPLHQRRSFTVNELLTVNRKIGDQTNLNREERERNVQGAYSVAHSTTNWAQILEGREVLLVDDVVTTGSSVREGIRTLRQAGIWPLGVLAAGVSPRLFS